MSQFFISGGQSIGVSASASVLPTNIQDWFSLGWTGWISLQSKGLSRVFSNTTVQRYQFCSAQLPLHTYMTTGKTTALIRQTFVGKAMSLLFNTLSRWVGLLPRSKRLLISWLPSPYAVILEPLPPKKVSHCFHCFPIYLPRSDGTRCHDRSFLKVEFKPTFSLSSFTSIKRLFSSSVFSAAKNSIVHNKDLHIPKYWYCHDWETLF